MDARASGLTLKLGCRVRAPRDRVFRALAEPADLARWWGPHGFITHVLELDLRVGGGYRFTMQPPEGDAFHLSGEYLEVVPPHRLVYTFRWDEPDPDDRETTATLRLDAPDEETEITLSQGEFATVERLELHRSGWTDSFERLRELMESSRG
ncbi:MAG TPA: SRPBCC domain-containing protein [Nocardioidaceae bacterium]|nr:SRPBCC domain-containing protein [Nocardioidaceae bacterium]